MKITVLGCGRWGSFHAWYADHIGHDVTLWGRPGSQHLQELMDTRQNEYLHLPDSVSLTSDRRQLWQQPISASSPSAPSSCAASRIS